MKVLIVGPGKMKYMPYANLYLDNIDWKAHDIHVAYWNRDEKEEDLSHYNGLHFHEFKKFMLNDASLLVKIRLFYSYRRFCISLLKKYKFDYVIVLHSIPGVVLYDYLVKHFPGRYIFDYRDSTYEPILGFFKRAVGNLIRNSTVTFTSSDGFRIYFPADTQQNVITSHNLLEDSLSHRNFKKSASAKIRVAFWGFIRHIDLNKHLIDRIGADNRFELHYYGREQYEAIKLKEYAQSNGFSNVFFHGEYKPSDRYDFAESTDIIHNIYQDKNMSLAVANKYYDGVIFKIPQICFPESQMANMCLNAGVGMAIDPRDPEFCNLLYEYYSSLDKEEFNKNSDIELERVMREYNNCRKIIGDIF